MVTSSMPNLRRNTLNRISRNDSNAPSIRPPAAISTKLNAALGNENTPVTAAAMANLKATRPEASFISDSPSSIR
ncbi:hypothetical protein D3C71_1981880 [compost metagenome]